MDFWPCLQKLVRTRCTNQKKKKKKKNMKKNVYLGSVLKVCFESPFIEDDIQPEIQVPPSARFQTRIIHILWVLELSK